MRDGQFIMSLREKSKSNATLGYELKEKGDYNSAVNRLYYSIFQKLSYSAEQKWGYTKTENDLSSHEALIQYVANKIQEAKEDDAKRTLAFRAMQTPNSFRQIKSLRVKADYSGNHITEEQMNDCIKHLDLFNIGYSSLSNL